MPLGLRLSDIMVHEGCQGDAKVMQTSLPGTHCPVVFSEDWKVELIVNPKYYIPI